MQLLVVPLAVAVAAGWLNLVQADREGKRETRREQDAVLDAYLSQIANLLLHENLGEDGDEKPRSVARGQTLTALRRLDGARKGIVIGFLSDSKLISAVNLEEPTWEEPTWMGPTWMGPSCMGPSWQELT